MERQQYTKIETAIENARQAIECYFTKPCPAALVTLIGAAHEVSHDIAKRGGVPDYLYSRQKKSKAHKEKNFCKHADRDHDKTMAFSEEKNEALILAAIHNIITIERRKNPSIHFPEFSAFIVWLMLHQPELLDIKLEACEMTPQLFFLSRLKKADFYEKALKIFNSGEW